MSARDASTLSPAQLSAHQLQSAAAGTDLLPTSCMELRLLQGRQMQRELGSDRTLQVDRLEGEKLLHVEPT